MYALVLNMGKHPSRRSHKKNQYISNCTRKVDMKSPEAEDIVTFLFQLGDFLGTSSTVANGAGTIRSVFSREMIALTT